MSGESRNIVDLTCERGNFFVRRIEAMLEKGDLFKDVGVVRIARHGDRTDAAVVVDETFDECVFVVLLIPNPFVAQHRL